MHRHELRQRERPPLRLEIEPLPAYHPLDPARLEQLRRHVSECVGGQRQLLRRGREHPRRHGYQQEAHPGGCGNVELAVGRRAPSAEVVVVHAGEIVVDERVGMYRLDRGGHACDGRRGAADRAESPENERGPPDDDLSPVPNVDLHGRRR